MQPPDRVVRGPRDDGGADVRIVHIAAAAVEARKRNDLPVQGADKILLSQELVRSGMHQHLTRGLVDRIAPFIPSFRRDQAASRSPRLPPHRFGRSALGTGVERQCRGLGTRSLRGDQSPAGRDQLPLSALLGNDGDSIGRMGIGQSGKRVPVPSVEMEGAFDLRLLGTDVAAAHRDIVAELRLTGSG